MPLVAYIIETCFKATLGLICLIAFSVQNYWHWNMRVSSDRGSLSTPNWEDHPQPTAAAPGAGGRATGAGAAAAAAADGGGGGKLAAGDLPVPPSGPPGFPNAKASIRTRSVGGATPAVAVGSAVRRRLPFTWWENAHAYLAPNSPRGIKRLFVRMGWVIALILVSNSPDSNGGLELYPPLVYRFLQNASGSEWRVLR